MQARRRIVPTEPPLLRIARLRNKPYGLEACFQQTDGEARRTNVGNSRYG